MADITFNVVMDYDHHCWRCDGYINNRLECVYYGDYPTEACQKADSHMNEVINNAERNTQWLSTLV